MSSVGDSVNRLAVADGEYGSHGVPTRIKITFYKAKDVGGVKIYCCATIVGTHKQWVGATTASRTGEDIRPERSRAANRALQERIVRQNADSGADHGPPIALDVPRHAHARRKRRGKGIVFGSE